MSSIQVTKSNTGWTVNKNGISFEVTDKNANGKFDKEDLCKELSGKGNSLNTDDLCEVKYQVLQLGDGATPEEMAQYSNYKEQKAAREKYSNQPQYQQQQTQQPAKKKGFWGTFGQVAGVVGRGAMGFMGMLLGFSGGGNAWAFNSNSGNDWGVRTYSGYTGGMLAGSNALGMGAGLGMGGMNVGGGNYGAGLAQIMQMQNDENAKRNEEYQKWNEEYKANQETQKAEVQKKATVDKAEQIRELAQKEGATICDNNIDAIDNIYDGDAEEYNEEQTAIINKIAAYPEVPHNIIANSKEETGKLSDRYAAKLDKKIKAYEKAPNDLKKSEVMDASKYEKIKELFEKAKTQDLTEADIKLIKEIIDTPIDKKEAEKK